LYSAFTRVSPGGVSYYTFEYTIRTEKWYRHNMVGGAGVQHEAQGRRASHRVCRKHDELIHTCSANVSKRW